MSVVDADEVTRLAELSQRLDAPVVAIELQWEVAEDDELRAWWELEVHAIIATAGATDSRFSSCKLCSLPAEEPAERVRAAALARALAAALGVAACMPALEAAGGRHGSRWIEAQGEAPAVSYSVHWEVYTWSDAGERVDDAGVATVVAPSGRAACEEAERQVEARYGAAVRPVYVRCAIDGMYAGSWMCRRPPRRGELPTPDELRGWHVEGRSIATIVDALRVRSPAATVLEIMLALEAAFELNLATLAPVSAWGRGQLTGAALDDALDETILARRASWGRPRRLRVAHARGESLVAALRAERAAGAGAIELMKALCEAFRISLRDAKGAIDRLFDDRDALLDLELARAIAAARNDG